MLKHACSLLILAIAAPALADVDPQLAHQGEVAFTKSCSICHTKEPNRNKIGPSLFGVVGRKAGSAPGFKYSDAMSKADVVWTAETLDRHIADPKSVVPGNKMTFPGLKNPEDRKEVIAFLSTLH